MEFDKQAIWELRAIMDERGVPHETGELISLAALPNTRQMVDWLVANPEASREAMWEKAWEVGVPDLAALET